MKTQTIRKQIDETLEALIFGVQGGFEGMERILTADEAREEIIKIFEASLPKEKYVDGFMNAYENPGRVYDNLTGSGFNSCLNDIKDKLKDL
jgi:hypothetical protein